MMITSPPLYLYGILGKPLGHSLSPLLHNWAFARLGHPGAYFAWEKPAEELEAFFSAVRTLPIAGLSVTLPHKEAAGAFLDALAPRAQCVGAVNTVYRQGGRLLGDNTDVAGFLAPLRGVSGMLPERALLLGAGGVCRAALAGLRELGFRKIVVAARSRGKAERLRKDFGCELIPWEHREEEALAMPPLLVINATPLGMRGQGQHESPVSERLWRALTQRDTAEQRSLAYDLVYTPVTTLFLAQAGAAGIACLDGLSFFMAQAMEQLRLWTGAAVPRRVEADARALLRSRLEPD